MKIGIDARFLTHAQKGGFKTYSENLINALAEIDPENEYILYLDRPPQQTTRLPMRSHITHRVVPGTLPMVGAFWREQIGLARQAARDRLDLFHAPSLTAPLALPCPLALTIHDMIWLDPWQFSRQSAQRPKRRLLEWYYRLIPRLAAQRAAVIVTVSYAAKKSIVEQLPVAADRVFVTHEAANPLYAPIHDEAQRQGVRRKYKLEQDFVLALGSADPRKNMATLIHAFALLPADLRRRYQLVIPWTHSCLMAEVIEQVQQIGLRNAVRFLENVSNADLLLLYNAAALFAFPSRCEGFGLPLVEAMACGTPVVAANNSSIPEVVGEAALLFPAEDAALLATCMAQVLTDPTLAATLAEKGRQRAAQFSWQNCAQQTLTAYRYACRLYEKRGVDPKPLTHDAQVVVKAATPIKE